MRVGGMRANLTPAFCRMPAHWVSSLSRGLFPSVAGGALRAVMISITLRFAISSAMSHASVAGAITI